MKSLLFLCFFALYGFIFSSVFSQDMKIGFVNYNEILLRMPEMRSVEQRLQNFQQKKQQEFFTEQQEFQTAIEQYQQRAGVISEEARTEEEERLSQLEIELFQLRNNIQQELQTEYENLTNPLIQQVREAINIVAERHEFEYMLNITTPSGDVVVLHINEQRRGELDITDEVMAELGI